MALTRFLRNYFFLVTGTPGFRFRTGDKPNEATFMELFCSTGFIKESADTASLTSQGFLKIAQDTAAQTRNSTVDVDQFTKAVLPHMLPNVYKLTGNTAIAVTSVVQATGRTGGTGLDFFVQNTLAITAPVTVPANPIVVTQVNPGENATITFNLNALAALPGKVLINALDLTAVYLEDAFTTNTPCRISFDAAVGNQSVDVDIKDKIHEVTMYYGTNAEYAVDFTAGVGNAGGCWDGWVVCDGNVYQNSQSVNVQTPNMIGRIPIGFNTGTLTPTMGTATAIAADIGTPVTIATDVVLLFVLYIG